MEYLVGALGALCICGFATLAGYDRDRAFYPTLLSLVASSHSVFTLAGGATLDAVMMGVALAALFVVAAVVAYRKNLWVAVAAFVAHGLVVSVRGRFSSVAFAPEWWASASLAFNLVVCVYLARKLTSGEIRRKPWVRITGGSSLALAAPNEGATGPATVSTSILPTDEELASIVPTPESIVWRRSSDIRLFMSSGYALLLQVAHPTVGAGVRDHSVYAKDPAGRLVRTLDYVNALTYGGPEEAARVGRQMREMHKRIKGTSPDGRAYHSLEPGAFAWVHATLLEASVTAHARFGRPMDEDQRQRFYAGYKRLGRLHGVRDRDLPDTWEGFQSYFDEMVETRLENNDAVQELLRNMRKPVPPMPWIPDAVWRLARRPITHVVNLAATGMLPPALRRRFELTWTSADEQQLRLLGATLRSTTPLLPEPLRVTGPRYLRLRRTMNERFSRTTVRA